MLQLHPADLMVTRVASWRPCLTGADHRANNLHPSISGQLKQHDVMIVVKDVVATTWRHVQQRAQRYGYQGDTDVPTVSLKQPLSAISALEVRVVDLICVAFITQPPGSVYNG